MIVELELYAGTGDQACSDTPRQHPFHDWLRTALPAPPRIAGFGPTGHRHPDVVSGPRVEEGDPAAHH
jgi:hypothetical protein